MFKRNASSDGHHDVGELLGQDCGGYVWEAFDKLVQSEMNLKCASYVKRGQGYEFDANAEKIRWEIQKRIRNTFLDVFETLGRRNPEYIYEIESLFEKLRDERSIEK